MKWSTFHGIEEHLVGVSILRSKQTICNLEVDQPASVVFLPAPLNAQDLQYYALNN